MNAPALTPDALARADLEVWGMTATLAMTDPRSVSAATAVLTQELAAMEAACSRFRPDSEISRILRHPGVEQTVSPLLNAAIDVALRVASATGSLVDPTVGAAVIALGYDRDFAELPSANAARRRNGSDQTPRGQSPHNQTPRGQSPHNQTPRGQSPHNQTPRAIGPNGTSTDAGKPPAALFPGWGPAPGAWRIRHDPARRALLIPAGVAIDLGATAKALVADRAAARIARLAGCGALVGIGGDIAVAGEHPPGGWRVAIGEHHRTAELDRDDLVAISCGGLATSSIVARSWLTATGTAHHIIDPRTGGNPEPCWRTVSAVAGSCVDANAAATAAIVLGAAAPGWLRRRGIPARMVFIDGTVHPVAGWPAESWHVDS